MFSAAMSPLSTFSPMSAVLPARASPLYVANGSGNNNGVSGGGGQPSRERGVFNFADDDVKAYLR